MKENIGTVPNLGDLTTDEYSFVIKMSCFPSLARAEKKFLRLAGEVARRAGGVSHPRIIPRGKQKGHYGRRKENKTAITTLRMANKTAIMAAWV